MLAIDQYWNTTDGNAAKTNNISSEIESRNAVAAIKNRKAALPDGQRVRKTRLWTERRACLRYCQAQAKPARP